MQLKVTNISKHLNAVKTEAFPDENKLKAADTAKKFESLLTSMMLKSMNGGTKGLFGEDSFGGDYFDMIFQNEIASSMSKGKGLGIAEMIYKKITGEELSELKDIKNDIIRNVNSGTKQESSDKSNDNAIKNINSNIQLTPSMRSIERLGKYEDIVDDASRRHGVDKDLIKSVILAESAGNDRAISSAKAKGLMQLIDSTASDMGVNNVWDPRENINGGTKYLAYLMKEFNGDINKVLAGYNAGPGNVIKHGGIPPFEETKNYVVRVTGYINHFKNNKNEQQIASATE